MNFYQLLESTNRYSVEVNFRTTMQEVTDSFAKMLLGYVSAALKNNGYHVKKKFDAEPYRIIASPNKWIDGEWVLVVSFHPNMKCFVMSKGFYNKDRDTVTVTDGNSEKCVGHSASEIYKTVFNRMAKIKDEKPHHVGGLKGVKGKTGPQQGSMRPAQGLTNKSKPMHPQGEDRMGM